MRKARKAQLKTVYRKTKVVLTCRGKKVFEAKGHSCFQDIEAFKQGWNSANAKREG